MIYTHLVFSEVAFTKHTIKLKEYKAFTGELTNYQNALCYSIGDLNGDGSYKFIIKSTNGTKRHDPVWWDENRGQTTIQAYRHDGTFTWSYTLDKRIEAGVHNSPVISYDIDGDGKMEVYTKNALDKSGTWPQKIYNPANEELLKLDPVTGKILKKVPWPQKVKGGI